MVNMKILIKDSRKIFAIQKEFNEQFPYLKIELFSKPHTLNGSSPKKFIKKASETIGNCRTVHKDGNISITPSMTVAELEKNFRDVYGLSVQVFRHSGNAWLETTVTDGWTLEEQNSQGRALSEKKA